MLEHSLKGIRVIELCNFVSGPLVGLVLADLGADVIKIERLDGGDDGRLLPPFLDGEGYFFTETNRRKRSIALDVTSGEGRAITRALVDTADVVLDNFRPGVMRRLGLDDATLRGRNPRLITCSVTGFGEDNAYAERAGYDPILQAMSGLMFVTGFDGQPPVRVGPSIVDKVAASWAATGVIAALFERERTGKGQRVSTSLLGAAVHIMASQILTYKATGREPRRMGGAGAGGGPAGSFLASDNRWVQIAVGNDRIFRRFCEAVDRPELADDPNFALMTHRVANADAMTEIVEEMFQRRPAAEWIERLTAKGVPCGPVNKLSDFVADPEVARSFLWEAPRSTGNKVPQVHTPISGNNHESLQSGPPRLGEHTDSVLRNELGYDDERMAALRASGVVA